MSGSAGTSRTSASRASTTSSAAGFTPRRLFLVEGVPGSGKTTLALQFLLAGAAAANRSCTSRCPRRDDELHSIAESHGWSSRRHRHPRADPVGGRARARRAVHDVPPVRGRARGDHRSASSPTSSRSKPTRVGLRLAVGAAAAGGQPAALSPPDPRAEAVLRRPALHRRAARRPDQRPIATCSCRASPTASCCSSSSPRIRRRAAAAARREVSRRAIPRRLSRLRHPARRPRGLPAARGRRAPRADRRAAGSRAAFAELDSLLGGGLERGTSTLIVGAAGTGKSTLAAQFAVAGGTSAASAARCSSSTRASQTLLTRHGALGIDLAASHRRRAPCRSSRSTRPSSRPGEFIARDPPRRRATARRIVVIDSLNGYLNAMPEERFLTIQLHELLMYLGAERRRDDPRRRPSGPDRHAMQTPVDASYLADAVVLLRYFEAKGEVRQAISVMKKRGGEHERTHPRVQARSRRHPRRRAPARVPRRAHRRAVRTNGTPVSTPRNSRSGSPTRMPPRSSLNSRMVRSCAPPRFFTTEIAWRTSPLRLEVAQQHHRVGEVARIDRRLHLRCRSGPGARRSGSSRRRAAPRYISSSCSWMVRKRSSGIAFR